MPQPTKVVKWTRIDYAYKLTEDVFSAAVGSLARGNGKSGRLSCANTHSCGRGQHRYVSMQYARYIVLILEYSANQIIIKKLLLSLGYQHIDVVANGKVNTDAVAVHYA